MAISPVLTPQGVCLTDTAGAHVEPQVQHVTWDPIMAEKGGYKHFMQKEIFEQPRAVRDTLLGRISQDTGKVFLDGMDITEDEFRNFRDVKIVACGTSWHAGLAGKFMIERMARIPVEVDYGSEFRYRDPILDSRTLVICISQSGETADTLAAQREAKQKGARKHWPSATSWAPWSRAKPTAPSSRMPALKSALPPPRPSPASSPLSC